MVSIISNLDNIFERLFWAALWFAVEIFLCDHDEGIFFARHRQDNLGDYQD